MFRDSLTVLVVLLLQANVFLIGRRPHSNCLVRVFVVQGKLLRGLSIRTSNCQRLDDVPVVDEEGGGSVLLDFIVAYSVSGDEELDAIQTCSVSLSKLSAGSEQHAGMFDSERLKATCIRFTLAFFAQFSDTHVLKSRTSRPSVQTCLILNQGFKG